MTYNKFGEILQALALPIVLTIDCDSIFIESANDFFRWCKDDTISHIAAILQCKIKKSKI